MQIIVFEDTRVQELKPLVNLKPVYGLYTGFRSLQEKFEHFTSGSVKLTYHMRRYLAPFYAEQHPELVINTLEDDDLLLVNGRLVCRASVARMIIDQALEPGKAYMQGDDLIFARLHRRHIANDNNPMPDIVDTSRLAGELVTETVSGFRIISHLWDVVKFHPDEIQHDAESLKLGRCEGSVHPSVSMINPSNIYIGKGAVVRAGAVLDADEGFVAVGDGAIIDPQAVLMQNVFLASRSRVKTAANIYSNVAIGMGSKIGGEVEDSLIEPFANKQHDGFLGHSYISSWCNLGAGTTTSDLKNNYSSIKLSVNGREETTGLQFLGLLMADHGKSSINSMFNTGTVVGTAANVFGGGFPPKEVHSFAWGGSQGFEPYDIEKALETARKVMDRRHIVMSSAYESMMRFIASTDGSSRLFV